MFFVDISSRSFGSMDAADFERLLVLMRHSQTNEIKELFNEKIKLIETRDCIHSPVHRERDNISQILMPEEFQGRFCAIKTKGDGNCLYNATLV